MGIEILIVFAAIIYAAFPRQTMNFVIRIAKRKDYVECYMKKHNTGFFEMWYKIPDSNHIVTIKKGMYYVPPEYGTLSGKRLRFTLDEADAIPEYQGRKDEDIIFQAQELKSTIVNKVAERLFNDKKEILYYILAGCVLVTFIALIYSLSKVSEMDALIAHLQTAPTATNSTIPSVVVK